MGTESLRAYAARLRRLPVEMPAAVASAAQPQLEQLAVEEYPDEHVRTGETRDSMSVTADGPVVIVSAGTAYAKYVDGAIPDHLRNSWISVFDASIVDVGNGILGGG